MLTQRWENILTGEAAMNYEFERRKQSVSMSHLIATKIYDGICGNMLNCQLKTDKRRVPTNYVAEMPRGM